MRYSKAFIQTKASPKNVQDIDKKDDEIVSYQLMARSGMIRKLASGIYEWLPLGLKVLQKVENIIRQEMNKKGCLEVLLPALQPKELWEKSGRWGIYGKELVRLKDRNDREFCLGPTHEEIVTNMVANQINSYRELPFILYQFQTKFRDEIRPRFGVMRSREFLMKDAYSFDKTDKDATKSYQDMYDAYSNIFKNCGLKFVIVEADSGAIGGNFSHEFMVLAETGESSIASCECGYAANTEKALGYISKNNNAELEKIMEKVETKNRKSIEDVSSFLSQNPEKFIKSLVYICDGKLVMVLVRGDREINEIKLANHLKSTDLRLATNKEILEKLGVEIGFLGPIGMDKNKIKIKIVADESIKYLKNAITGANKKDFHFVNVNLNRDFKIAEFVDLVLVKEGDNCKKCGKTLNFSRGIEVGHIFKLGTKYSKTMGAEYLDADGQKKEIVMGCYGIGVSRVVAATIEQNNDEKGIIWPFSLSPYQIGVICLDIKNEELFKIAQNIHDKLEKAGYEVL
ncbi:MAG: proline--tRNA ligase, partial [Elusimicrobiota bacterium]|nr:proline--tRNA ligase [Elusimicrobiota bacterium]